VSTGIDVTRRRLLGTALATGAASALPASAAAKSTRAAG